METGGSPTLKIRNFRIMLNFFLNRKFVIEEGTLFKILGSYTLILQVLQDYNRLRRTPVS